MADHLRPPQVGFDPLRILLNPDGRGRRDRDQRQEDENQKKTVQSKKKIAAKEASRARSPELSDELEQREKTSFARLLRGEH